MDEAISDIEHNTCATSYVTADNTRPMAYLILKVICKWKNKDWSIKKLSLFYPQNKIAHCLNNYPKHVTIFLILQPFARLPQLNCKRWIRTHCKWNVLINVSFWKMQSILVHRLWFRSYEHLFLTNMANSIPLFSGWHNTICKLPAYDITHWYDVRW
jgi:hypothetical protein